MLSFCVEAWWGGTVSGIPRAAHKEGLGLVFRPTVCLSLTAHSLGERRLLGHLRDSTSLQHFTSQQVIVGAFIITITSESPSEKRTLGGFALSVWGAQVLRGPGHSLRESLRLQETE